MQTTLIAALVALLLGFGAGWQVKSWQDDSKQLGVVEHATAVEHAEQVGANKATSNYVERTHANEPIKIGLDGLVDAHSAAARCPSVLPAGVQVPAGRPREGVPAVPGRGAETAGAATNAAAGEDAAFDAANKHDLREAVDLVAQVNWLIDLCLAAHCDMEAPP